MTPLGVGKFREIENYFMQLYCELEKSQKLCPKPIDVYGCEIIAESLYG